MQLIIGSLGKFGLTDTLLKQANSRETILHNHTTESTHEKYCTLPAPKVMDTIITLPSRGWNVSEFIPSQDLFIFIPIRKLPIVCEIMDIQDIFKFVLPRMTFENRF